MSREPFSEEFDAALHCADKWTKAALTVFKKPDDDFAWRDRVNPGDDAPKRQESDATIRARNVACTPVVAVHIEKEWVGANNGETGL